MKRFFRILFRVILVLLVVVIVLLASSIAPVDRSVPRKQLFYSLMMNSIDQIMDVKPVTGKILQTGFGKVRLTPSYTTSTAGYVKRKGAHFTSVRDSLYVRTIVLQRGGLRVALVSLDMLIVPPIVYERLEKILPAINWSINRVYLGATHTHNSVGQWDDHLVGETFAGSFRSDLVDFIVDQIVLSIQNASAQLIDSELYYASMPVTEAVSNRLIEGGSIDSLLHLVEIRRSDQSRGMLLNYTAHATCMSSKDLRLSRDYPGALVNTLEQNGYDFALFMAGAVGSHAPMPMADGDEKIERMATTLAEALTNKDIEWNAMRDSVLRLNRIPLQLGIRQVKLLPDWRARAWLSNALMGEYPVYLSVLQVGDVIMLGTPCDFSGMLTKPIYEAAEQRGLHAMVTSFNGGYIGYITPDEYYDLDKYETQTMNWYGPGNGSYMQDCMVRIIKRTRR